MNGPAADGGLSTLTNFVLSAVQLGALGFGAALFVMVFIILIRNQAPADEHTARLRSRFLTMGVAAFAFAGLMQLVTLFWGPKPEGAYRVSVVFAPDPGPNGLPEPVMRLLPAGADVKRNTPFTVDRDLTLSVGVDDIVNKTRNLAATADALSRANVTLTQQAAAMPAGTNVLQPAEVREFKALNDKVRMGLQKGDYGAAAQSSIVLRDCTVRAAKP